MPKNIGKSRDAAIGDGCAKSGGGSYQNRPPPARSSLKLRPVRQPEHWGTERHGGRSLQIDCSFGFLGDWRSRRRLAWRVAIGRRASLRFGIAEISQHLKHLAARRKHPAAGPLVGFHRLHELKLVVRIVAFASGRINLAPTANFRPPFELPTFDRHGHILRPALAGLAAIIRLRSTAIDSCRSCLGSRFEILNHGRRPLSCLKEDVERGRCRSSPLARSSSEPDGGKIHRLRKIVAFDNMNGLHAKQR